ncbi:uncharacterized protein N7529_001338 [Penicillium soppii]|uniref:uncharacterized protein n=1 Tax=Penicillium soppii TaxID=69789 RepID=UPI002548FD78|nr:uncharacterized protein N7529_001338 [Penicillium soppii]KAJ5882666.1 hypothetical protein N7529_001338 [Penicillium soppii]
MDRPTIIKAKVYATSGIREISQYLDSGRFPAIASLTRDVLSILVTGASVERLFNTARDIYYYRRGRMKSRTIKELMMFLYTSKFDLEVEEAKQLKKLYSHKEIEALKEEREEKPDDINILLINDIEEGDKDEPIDLIDIQDKTVKKGLGTTDLDLLECSTQVRTSGRKRKTREDKNYKHY